MSCCFSDETLNSIKGIIYSSVNNNSADETDSVTGGEWKPFENDAFISSSGSGLEQSNSNIEFHGMKLRQSVDDSSNHNAKKPANNLTDAPPGFNSTPTNGFCNGTAKGAKKPILDLPPGFEFTVSEQLVSIL